MSVEFEDGTEPLGVAAVDAQGVARLTVAGLTPGDHVIRAIWRGDGNNLTPTPISIVHTVTGAETRTSLTPVSTRSARQTVVHATVAVLAPRRGNADRYDHGVVAGGNPVLHHRPAGHELRSGHGISPRPVHTEGAVLQRHASSRQFRPADPEHHSAVRGRHRQRTRQRRAGPAPGRRRPAKELPEHRAG
ncbi:Ig-like domain-containing protein [Chiayiivirga sp.]|uniref:Ig-like domain-containing protein n=1 Tax=Chiayiivirga sp. TaxID=2041042 RepID=UPI003DA8EAD6